MDHDDRRQSSGAIVVGHLPRQSKDNGFYPVSRYLNRFRARKHVPTYYEISHHGRFQQACTMMYVSKNDADVILSEALRVFGNLNKTEKAC